MYWIIVCFCWLESFFCFLCCLLLHLNEDFSKSWIGRFSFLMIGVNCARMGLTKMVASVEARLAWKSWSVVFGWIPVCFEMPHDLDFFWRFAFWGILPRYLWWENRIDSMIWRWYHQAVSWVVLEECLSFVFPRSFLRRSFLWFWMFCSSVLFAFFGGLLSPYCAKSVSRSFFVPNLAMPELRTRT